MTRRESAWLVALAILALAPRLAFVTLFPARPYTDFFNLVRFAEAFNETPFAAGHFGWRYFGLGVPLPLSMVLRMTTAPANDVARYATAVLTGLTALLPFVLWRGALGLPARVVASLLLALWPGHVFFSGVVTPDNWILPPSIALAALAVRALARADEGHPVAAALALCAAGAVRPEMFVVLLPLVAAAAGLFRAPRQWAWRRIAAGAAAGALALLLMAGTRWAGSGRFSATTEHSGLAVLGSFAPGGGGWYWTSPQIYFAAVVPQVALHPPEMGRLAPALALHEARRRPAFHLLRCFAGPTKSLLHSDRSALFWSIGFPGALSGPRQKQAQALMTRLTPLLEWSTFALLSVCAAGCLLALRRRAWPVLVIAASMALKVLVHAVTVSQTRYFIVVTAFALLVVALIVEEARRRPLGREAVAALFAGLVLVGALRLAAHRAEAYIIAADDEQLTYRFTLTDPSRVAWLQCVVREGRLTALWAAQAAAAVRLLHADPQPGESATAECRAWATRAATLELRLRDPYDAGGFPDRIVQTVTVDGQERLRHDLAAEPGGGWMSAPLGALAPGQSRAVVLRVAAGRADPGWSWGAVAETEFRLALAAP